MRAALRCLVLSFLALLSVGEAIAACDKTVVDLVWTGTRLRFGSVATEQYAFIAYFDADRRFTVARIDLASCIVVRKRLDSVFEGWDGHNFTAIALDEDMRLHVAGNMHAGPLIYFRATVPLDVESLQPAEMVGGQERRVSYPNFVRQGEQLLFMYRQGVAANGIWHVNAWSGDSWSRVNEEPIFGADRDGVIASAYPSEYELGPDGFFHVAVVWRGDPGVENDFRVSYAKTDDFTTWLSAADEPLPTPLDPDTMDTVDDVGREGGLVNNAKVDLDGDGQPYVIYTKYTESGRNGAYLAVPAPGGWRSTLMAESLNRTTIERRGPSGKLPRINKGNSRRGASVAIRFPGEPVIRIRLARFGISPDPSSEVPTKIRREPIFDLVEPHLSNPGFMNSRTRTSDGRTFADLHFTWVTQGPNKGKPRACTPEAPAACNPPASPLLLSRAP